MPARARHQWRRQHHEAVERARRRLRCVTRHSCRRSGLRRSAEPGARRGYVVWASLTNYPGYLVRLTPGENPPETCITERYRVPEPGFGPRGLDVDTNGVVWTSLAGSSHMASFDRNQCDMLAGPETPRGRSLRRRLDVAPHRWADLPRARTCRPTSSITTGWTCGIRPVWVKRALDSRWQFRCAVVTRS